MIDVIKHIDGYKTIIIGIAIVVAGLYNGDNALILQGVGLITLRLGIKKIEVARGNTDNNSIDVDRR